ncbi:MAG: hypothetical protein ACRDGQ_09680 [Candidatus Limnocylindrales bacterium]
MGLDIETAYRRHRLAFVGTGAVVVAAVIGYLQLRRGSAPIIVAAAPASGSVAPSTDPLAAFGAGATAAASGFDQGSALGQAALGVAGGVVANQSGVAETLAGSQAALGATLGQVLGQVTLPSQGTSPLPAPTPMPGSPPIEYPGPIVNPTPIPTPLPITAPPPASTASPHYTARVTVATALWNDGSQRWVYNGPNAIKVGTILDVRGAHYLKGGVSTLPIGSGTYAGYYVPAAHVTIVKLGYP